MPDHPMSDRSHHNTDALGDIRAQLRDLLPRAVACAVASYQDFSQNLSPDDAKQFIAHHNACRAALAHLDALTKLTRWLIVQHPQSSDQDDLQPLLLQARQVLMRLEHPALHDDTVEDTDESSD